MKKKVAARKNPLFKGENTLDFGEDVAIHTMTHEEESTLFLSHYQLYIDPLTRYAKYFETSAKDIDYLFLEIKRYHMQLVLKGKWSEDKYVAVLDDIFTNRAALTVTVLDALGFRYDKGTLDAQRTTSSRRR